MSKLENEKCVCERVRERVVEKLTGKIIFKEKRWREE